MPICDLTNPPLRPSRSREDVRANGPASNECTSHVPQRHNIPSQHEYLSKALPIKLPPPHINPILAHRASQILHRQHRSALPSASASTSKPSSRHSQHMRPTLSLILPLLLLLLRLLRRCRQTCCRTRGCRGRGRGWCRGARGGRAHARVLVSVGGNVGDELLGGEGEEAREGKRGGGGRESGKSEVVLSYSIWDDWSVVVHFGEKVSKGNVLSGRNAGFRRGFDQRVLGLRGGVNDHVHIGVKSLIDRVVGLGGGVE